MIEITAAGLKGWVERQAWLVECIGVAEREAVSENLLTRVDDYKFMGGALCVPPTEKPTGVCAPVGSNHVETDQGFDVIYQPERTFRW